MKIHEAAGTAAGGFFDTAINMAKGLKGLVGLKNPFKSASQRKELGLSKEDQIAYNNFTQKFVNRGLNSIKTAAQGGLFDPTSNKLVKIRPPKPIPALAKGVEILSTSPIIISFRDKDYTIDTTSGTTAGEWKQMDSATGQLFPQVLSPEFKTFLNNQFKIAKKLKMVRESYDYMNDMVENYIELFEAVSNVPSISQWVWDNFMIPYLKGINYESAKPQINAILQNLPNSYNNGTLENDLQRLADIVWALGSFKN